MKCNHCEKAFDGPPVSREVEGETLNFCCPHCSASAYVAHLIASRRQPDRKCMDCGEVKPRDEFFKTSYRCDTCKPRRVFTDRPTL